MCIFPKHFLSNPNEQKSNLEGRYVDIFIISQEIGLVDSCLCNLLSKEINSNVYWYRSYNKAIVCVLEEDVDAAIKAGKQIITRNFHGMSAEYISGNVRLPVFNEYSVFATFKTCSFEELSDFCNKIDNSLLVKINSKGEKCVLTNKPAETIPMI